MVSRSQCMYICQLESQCMGVEHQPETLECVLKQTHYNFEAILVDVPGWDLYETICKGDVLDIIYGLLL